MNIPPSLPDDTAQVPESGFLFDDWTPSEKSTATNPYPFDGKIIARMPDLGTESPTNNSEKPTFRPFKEKFLASLSSIVPGSIMPGSAPHAVAARQRLFQRITAVGCVVILCGLGIILLEQGSKSPKTITDYSEVISETITIPATTATTIPATEIGTEICSETASAPAIQPELTDRMPGVVPPPAIPIAPAESFAAKPASAPNPPEQADSIWNRPASDSYSPWNITQRQPEGYTADAVALESPPMPPSMPTAPSNVPPPGMVVMTHMVDMSMPVSPHEHQRLAQSGPPPIQAQAPIDPFLPVNHYAPHGMVPTQYRQENVPAAATPQYSQPQHGQPQQAQRVPPPPYAQYQVPQYQTPPATQGMHPQYPYDPNQHGQQVLPPNTPIPSGISTLPAQGGGYPPYPGGAASSAPPHPSSYYNVPPTYRRVY